MLNVLFIMPYLLKLDLIVRLCDVKE